MIMKDWNYLWLSVKAWLCSDRFLLDAIKSCVRWQLLACSFWFTKSIRATISHVSFGSIKLVYGGWEIKGQRWAVLSWDLHLNIKDNNTRCCTAVLERIVKFDRIPNTEYIRILKIHRIPNTEYIRFLKNERIRIPNSAIRT